MRKLVLLLCLIIGSYQMEAQVIKNSYIVDLKKGTAANVLENNRLLQHVSNAEMKMLSSDLDIIQITTDSKGWEEWLNNNPYVEHWGYNQYVHPRKVPNDEYFHLQWGLHLINAEDAWEVATGGHDINNREIVIAVLDESYDLDHPELEGRIFTNEGEIPDDGIDNDNNGYTDDYIGWNSTDESDNHPLTDNHGTAVSGIIGARTDNELGIAGINWQVKILPISGISTQAEVIASYQYVLNMRKRYNETNGQEGAYIVATNYSAGIDNAFGTDPQFKSWCDMYDALGNEGVLSTGATANKSVDVDIDGDMPTTCPSPFLISVTNTDETDVKVSNSGFGAINIDLGAPGKGTLALDTDAGYDQAFGGTSASAPHVSGTIALLYSVPCKAISELALQNPPQAAEIIRDAILNGTAPNSTLDGITSTGGRLDIFGAILELQKTCDINLPSPRGDLKLEKIDRSNPGYLIIDYLTPDESNYKMLLSDRIGRTIRYLEFTPPTLGRKQLRFDIPDLIPGIYIISIYNDDTISSQKLFVE